MQGTVAADLVLCRHATGKGKGSFAEHVLQKLEERERLSLLAQEEEEDKEDKKCLVPSPTEDKPSPTLVQATQDNEDIDWDKKNKEVEEAPIWNLDPVDKFSCFGLY